MTTKHWVVVLAIGLGCACSVAADDTDDRAVALINKLGGEMRRDEAVAGKPIVDVDLMNTKGKNEDLQVIANPQCVIRRSPPRISPRPWQIPGAFSGGFAQGIPDHDYQTKPVGSNPKLIDHDTIASYEKLGGEYGGFLTDEFSCFLRGETAASKGLPGFRFLILPQGEKFTKLQPVMVPFALALRDSNINDTCIKEIDNLDNLILLDLGGTKVGDDGVKELKRFQNIKYLYLYNTRVTDAGLKELQTLLYLNSLDLYATSVTGGGLSELKSLNNLNHLELGSTEVTDAGLKELNKLVKLTSLGLSRTLLTDAGMLNLKSLKNLASLGGID